MGVGGKEASKLCLEFRCCPKLFSLWFLCFSIPLPSPFCSLFSLSPPPPFSFFLPPLPPYLLFPLLLFCFPSPTFVSFPPSFSKKKTSTSHVLSTHVLMLKTWECGCVGDRMSPTFFDFFFIIFNYKII